MLSKKDLHKFQRKGAKKITRTKRCILMADMGLGKTIMSLTAFAKIKADKPHYRALIVAPPSVAENTWQDEVESWSHINHLSIEAIRGKPDKRLDILKSAVDIHVLPSSLLQWFAQSIDTLIKTDGYTWPYDWLFFDESSMYRTPGSKRSKIAYRATLSTERVTLLTATPTPRDYYNLYQQLKLIDNGDRLGKTQGQYEQRFFNVFNRGYFKQISLKKNAKKKIHKAIKDVCHRFDAADYLPQLPQLSENIIRVKVPQTAKNLYRELEQEQIVDFKGHRIVAENEAALSGKKHQIANGIVLDEDQEPVVVHTAKLDRLKDLLREIGGRNVLIAYTHKADRDAILRSIDGAVWFKGSKSGQRKWNRLKNNGLRFVCHPASMGHGLNLQKGGSIVIWYGLPRDFELYEQMRGRVHRQGQQDTCIIHNLIADLPVDEHIYDVLQARKKSQEGLLEAMK